MSRWIKKLFYKYRFVIMTDDSFEERFSVKITRMSFFWMTTVLVVLGFGSSFLLMSNTSLKELIPGKSDNEIQQKLTALTNSSDSLINVLKTQKAYLKNMRNIITGEVLNHSEDSTSIAGLVSDISFKKSTEDSLLRVSVESENLGSITSTYKGNNNLIVFFAPLMGIITDGFDRKTKHFGLDVVAKEKSRISSVLDGTVVISTWSSETGYVIGVQHQNGYLSLYKHNSIILKSIGDFVSAGEHVAIIGNSGDLSSGPHLHFELWHEGIPVNPENYIVF